MTPHTAVVAAFVVLGLSIGQAAVRQAVEIRQDPAKHQYVVSVGGKHFTTYSYGDEFLDKPVFYPVVSPNGARVNREYPMVERVPGESADHPHHQSLFFTYDEVNGTNFWNPERTGRRIQQREARVQGDTLVAVLDWKAKDGSVVLEETKRVRFGGAMDAFWLDHDSVLLARGTPVAMGDTKEGAFGLRLNDTLKEAGGSGRYINAEGLETAANVWGKRSPWVAIRGAVKDREGTKPVTVAIFAHPSSLNSPPYWHARDYGLFAVNPFARRGYDPSAPERITRLDTGQSVHVRFRLVVYAGMVDKARLDRDFASFTAGGRQLREYAWRAGTPGRHVN
jgi:hypothetical protein